MGNIPRIKVPKAGTNREVFRVRECKGDSVNASNPAVPQVYYRLRQP